MIVDLSNNDIGVGIRGMGYYIPEDIVTNHDMEKIVDTTDEWIQKKIGIKERHIAKLSQATSDLAIIAGERAIKESRLNPLDIDLVIVTTMTPDHIDPMPCSLVAYKLGCTNAAAFNLSVGGCPDSVYSIITAAQYIISGAFKNVLVINTEINSRFVNWEDRTTCVYFGDGAGAWVLAKTKKGKGILGFVLGADGSGYDTIIIDAGGSRMPITEFALDNKLNYLKMDGKKVFEFAIKVFPESIEQLLDKLNLTKNEISLYLSHQANINIINKSLEKIGVSEEKSYTNIDKYGNMTSASLPVVFAEALEKKLVKPQDIISLTAFGAGLAWGTMFIKLTDKEEFY
mgnify:CR=1 FL=1